MESPFIFEGPITPKLTTVPCVRMCDGVLCSPGWPFVAKDTFALLILLPLECWDSRHYRIIWRSLVWSTIPIFLLC